MNKEDSKNLLKRYGGVAFLLVVSLFWNGRLQATQPQLSFTDTVTKTEDSDDGVCDADCSLREAIEASNANLLGQDTIAFDIPENDPQCDPKTHVCMIQPTSPLPEITDSVILDGYTQPGASPNTLAEGDDAVLRIELDGFQADSDVLRISASGSVVRGLVIHHFKNRNAITLNSSNQTRIEGNFIGTDPSGTAQLEGGCEGIDIIGGSQNVVGGDVPGDRNIVSVKSACEGSSTGIVISSGSFENRVEGNFIGTDKDGKIALPNGQGIFIGTAAQRNVIGGLTSGTRNIISGNLGSGVSISSIDTMGNRLEGNFIGTDVTGLSPLGNGGQGGVWILSFATKNFVGGEEPGAGNVIAFNLGSGVNIREDSLQNAISSNSIFLNGGLGIDLNGDGVTPNDADPLDADTGGNDLQNFPVIRSAVVSNGETTLQGELNSLPQTIFRLEFFSNDACSPSGNGEGQAYLGTTEVTTDDGGNASFELNLPETATDFVTATATDPRQNTSEFSTCLEVLHPVDAVRSTIPADNPAGTGSQNGLGPGPAVVGGTEGAGCSLNQEGGRLSPFSTFLPFAALAIISWRRQCRS